jgi:hypothetical protein
MTNDLNVNANKKTINVYLDIDYNTYKNKIKSYIFTHINLVFDIFDEEFIENFVKLYILYKKDLLESDYKIYGKLLIDFYNYLKSLANIDQEEYFFIIIKLLNIYILILEKINVIGPEENSSDKSIDFRKVKLVGDKYIKLIDLSLLNDRIIKCIKQIGKENVVAEIFLLFVNKENKHSKQNIMLIGEKLSWDFFMYWTSEELYRIITTNINVSNNKLLSSIRKYKKYFFRSYNYKVNILKNIYFEQVNTKIILKHKLLKDYKLFNELIKDINAINLEIK